MYTTTAFQAIRPAQPLPLSPKFGINQKVLNSGKKTKEIIALAKGYRQRQFIRAHLIEDLGYGAIAKRYYVSFSTVRKAITRIANRLPK